ncbi:MAG: S-adenosyl-l-methionine hydroxide adenosyltransferase family protein [Archaeoglobales archaeon]|nr:S-adenosyl-l-methionine hydroxide adenosyltransferase family protein [Archaeoglobales archaeon]
MIVTLLTDFGDFYPGVMKGVILRINPEARIVDITHSIEPHNILQGAFLLYHSYRYFPSSVHVAVVDPTVGGKRDAIVVFTESSIFVAPDNGICFPSARECGIKKIFKIKEAISELVGELSSTFHGRDVFAPTAALLAAEKMDLLSEYLVETTKMKEIEIFDCKIDRETVRCKVVYVDRFGNLVTNLKREYVDAKGYSFAGIKFPLKRTYSDVSEGDPLSLIGSFNTLELSVRNGSAAEMLGIKKGGIEIELEVIK